MAAPTASHLKIAGRLFPHLRMCASSGTAVRFEATKSTSSRIQGETIGFDEHDTIKRSGSLAQGDLKSKPGESARRAAEEKVGRDSSASKAPEDGSEQEKVSSREEVAAEAGI